MLIEYSEYLVWVLVHSVWQGAVLALLCSSALRLFPARRAEWRYFVTLVSLGLLLLAMLVTWSVQIEIRRTKVTTNVLAPSEPAKRSLFSGTTGPQPTVQRLTIQQLTVQQLTAPDVTVELEPAPVAILTAADRPSGQLGVLPIARASAVSAALERWAPAIAAVWLCGALIMLARSLCAVVIVSRWRTQSDVDQSLVHDLSRIAIDLQGHFRLRKHVPILISHCVQIPSVVGVIWPCILIPPAMASGLTVEQWRIVLSHELAHIRRYDLIVNVLQMAIESMLFFNPAVWWLSRQIRREREACCDLQAAQVCGQPIAVARTLLDVAQQLGRHVTTSPRPALAFADEVRPGELSDRVERLVRPDRAIAPRLSLFSLLAVSATCAVCLWTMSAGTNLAVQIAVEMMSPKERVEKLERIQSQYSGIVLPPEPKRAAEVSDTLPGSSAEPDAPTKSTVELIVKTADGSPLPALTQMQYCGRNGNSSISSTIDALGKPTPEYRKVVDIVPGSYRIGVNAPGWAPITTEVRTIHRGEHQPNIEVILQRGRQHSMIVRNEAGQPIPGVAFKGGAVLEISGGSSSSLGIIEAISDAAGVVNFADVGDLTYSFQMRCPGYARDDLRGILTQEKMGQVTLKKALPTKVRIVAADDGHPVSGARLVIAMTKKNQSSHSYQDPRMQSIDDPWTTLALSDAEGWATLDELSPERHYTFGVIASDYGMAILSDVSSGAAPQTVKLPAPLTVRGHITGDLSKLSPRRKSDGPGYTFGFQTQIEGLSGGYEHAVVEPDGHFTLTNRVLGERLRLQVPNHSTEVIVAAMTPEVVIDLDAKQERSIVPTRQVMLRLTGTAPGAPARGMIFAAWSYRDAGGSRSDGGNYPVLGNQATFEVPVNSRMHYRNESLLGYRIKDREDITVSPASEPLVIEVPAEPAGGIYGKIVRPDGSAASNGFVRVYGIQLPPNVEPNDINPSSSTSSSSFLCTLPLGGRYRVFARENTDDHNLWAISDEIDLTAANPIAEATLKLIPGQDVRVKVLGPNGEPVSRQTVTLKCRYWITDDLKSGYEIVRETQPDGVAVFQQVTPLPTGGPLHAQWDLRIPPLKYHGWQGPLTGRSIEVRLQAGLSSHGQVIDSATGRPIPAARLWMLPVDFAKSRYHQPIESTTDSQGEFHIGGLEPIEYRGYVDSTVPEGTVIKPLPDGRTTYIYPSDEGASHRLNPLDKKAVRWEVQLVPGSRLKPLPSP